MVDKELYTLAVGGAGQEMESNYFAKTDVMIGNTEGDLNITRARNGTKELTLDGDSYLSGAVEALGEATSQLVLN